MLYWREIPRAINNHCFTSFFGFLKSLTGHTSLPYTKPIFPFTVERYCPRSRDPHASLPYTAPVTALQLTICLLLVNYDYMPLPPITSVVLVFRLHRPNSLELCCTVVYLLLSFLYYYNVSNGLIRLLSLQIIFLKLNLN